MSTPEILKTNHSANPQKAGTLAKSEKPAKPYVEQESCRIVYGSLPLSLMGKVLKGMPRDAVMDMEAATLMGAAMVVGLPADLERLKLSLPVRMVPEPWHSTIGRGASDWVSSGQIGSSSNFMLYTMTGFNAMEFMRRKDPAEPADVAYPHDPSDLRRCRLLLEAAPELAERLDEMSVQHPVWARLVENWSTLCSTMDEETPAWRIPRRHSSDGRSLRTYALMDDLVRKLPASPASRP